MNQTNKKNIAILMGGESVERKISIKSGKHFCANLDSNEYNAYKILITEKSEWILKIKDEFHQINKSNFSFKLKNEIIKFDVAIVLIHGEPAENGELSKYFDSLNIPYSCCDEKASLLTFNKFNCNNFLRKENFNVPESNTSISEMKKITFPCIVKPTTSGSSFGVSKVNSKEQLNQGIEHAKKYSNQYIIEEFISGRELCCAVHDIEKNQLTTLPITEIISENEIFDYNAKYLGQSKEITPANIDTDLKKEIEKISEKAYLKLKLKGIVRFDFIIKDKKPYIIEVNTIPGFSKESIVPQMIKSSNQKISDFISKLLNNILR